jgi:CubicO group peptidase (beta-lactamase class C family)
VLKHGLTLDYGYLWWTADTPQSQADHAFYAAGAFGQYIYIDPAARVIVVVTSAEPKPVGKEPLPSEAFFDAVVTALR